MTFATIDFLLAGCFLAGILINSSTCRPNEAKCLMYLDEVRKILGSKIPPINDSRMTDNYYNISRAFYPSVNLPALYVRVTIQFLKDYQNGTKMIDDQKKNLKFTWSKACSYVSGKCISLDEMSVFSLLTIYPQRRESELVMTVPPFCDSSPYAIDDDTTNKTWKYVVSTLEDIIVNPTISDPRLNTAGCVIIGHEGDVAEYPDLWFFYCFILASSALASFSLWIFLLQIIVEGMKIKVNENNQNKRRLRLVSGAVLKMACFFVITFLIVLGLLIYFQIKKGRKMYGYVVAYTVFSLFSVFIGCLLKCTHNLEGNITYQVGSCFLFPCLFQTVHHFLWVVCGIISEPFWAIPIFLLECLFASSILFALFLYENGFVNNPDEDKSLKFNSNGCLQCNFCIGFHLFLCWVSFALVLVTIALTAVNNGNAVNSPTAGAIEGVMTVIFLWLIKNFDFRSKKSTNEPGNNPSNEPSNSNMQRETSL